MVIQPVQRHLAAGDGPEGATRQLEEAYARFRSADKRRGTRALDAFLAARAPRLRALLRHDVSGFFLGVFGVGRSEEVGAHVQAPTRPSAFPASR